MSPEQAVLSLLLKGNKDDKLTFLRSAVSFDDFSAHEIEAAWVDEFFEEHGEFPSRTLFKQKFPHFRFMKVRDPLGTYLDLIHEKKSYEKYRALITDSSKLIDSNKFWKGLTKLKAGLERLSSTNGTGDITIGMNAISRLDHEEWTSAALMSLPWESIDQVVGGIEAGDAIAVIARTSIGKTWTLLKWAVFLWLQGYKVQFESKEMPYQKIIRRLDAIAAKIPYSRLRKGLLNGEQRARYKEYLQKIDGDERLMISGKETMEGVSLHDIRARIMSFRPDVVFIDAAYKLARGRNDLTMGMIELSEGICRVGRSSGVPIIASFQTNKSAEKKDGSTGGGLSATSWGDTINQDFDGVIEVHGERDDNVRTVSLRKWREGPLVSTDIYLFDSEDVPVVEEVVAVPHDSGEDDVEIKTVKVLPAKSKLVVKL